MTDAALHGAVPRARLVGMSRTGAPLVVRLHVDLGHVSSAVCMRG